ncbi:MAG: hypothetical protein Q8N37_00950 [bacterium]|nr:hypothetical protein [bacterium]
MKDREKLAVDRIKEIQEKIILLKKDLGAGWVIVLYRTGLPIVSTEAKSILEPEPRIIFSIADRIAKLFSISISLYNEQINEMHEGVIIEGKISDIIIGEINPDTLLAFNISKYNIWTKIKIAHTSKEIRKILE